MTPSVLSENNTHTSRSAAASLPYPNASTTSSPTKAAIPASHPSHLTTTTCSGSASYTLVATVETLRTLELLYRVNADDAELLVDIDELRQLLDMLEFAIELALEPGYRPLRRLVGEGFRSL